MVPPQLGARSSIRWPGSPLVLEEILQWSQQADLRRQRPVPDQYPDRQTSLGKPQRVLSSIVAFK